MDGWLMGECFVLRTTSVSPLDRDKDTLSLTRKTGEGIRRFSVTEKENGRNGYGEDQDCSDRSVS